MLQKLALHLAAQPDSPCHGQAASSAPQEAAKLTKPVQLEIEPRIRQHAEQVGEARLPRPDKERCDGLMADLETQRRRWEPKLKQKAIASAIDVPSEREKFAEELLQHAMDLYISPHGPLFCVMPPCQHPAV
eukprot:Skav236679  [mRNA]  locus=scaffold406:90000:92931:- [translate_table: standard]